MMEKWTLVYFLLVQFVCSSLAVGCATPPVVANALYSIQGMEGTTQVTYRCLKGRLFGARVLSCNATRQWDVAPPICREECGKPEDIPNAQLQFPHYKLETFAVHSKVQYECVPGFTKESGETAAVCLPDFRWDEATLVCKRKEQRCPNLNVHNVEITSGLKASYVPGDTVSIQCSPGFLLEGSRTFICNPEGTWHPALPKCVKKEFAHCGIKLEDWKPALENEKRCLEELKADLEHGKSASEP